MVLFTFLDLLLVVATYVSWTEHRDFSSAQRRHTRSNCMLNNGKNPRINSAKLPLFLKTEKAPQDLAHCYEYGNKVIPKKIHICIGLCYFLNLFIIKYFLNGKDVTKLCRWG